MFITGIWFVGSMVGIILVARFALYIPARKLAHAGGLSQSATGQLLGYLTSAPELVATVAAVLFGQLRRITGSRFRFEQAVVAGSIVVPVLLLVTGQDSALWSGIALGAGYIAYMRVMRSRQEVSGPSQSESAQKPWSGRRSHIVVQVLIVIAGLVGLYFLGDVLGDSVYELGVAFAVPAVILGALTAVATSLPELTTFFSSFAAHRKAGTDGNSEVVHNLMASNVVNLLVVQAVGVVAYTVFA